MSAWVSNHEKTVATKYGTTSPLLNVAKEYGLDYGDVLLYADCFCRRHYENLIHTSAAMIRIMDLSEKVRAELLMDVHAIMARNPNVYNPNPPMFR